MFGVFYVLLFLLLIIACVCDIRKKKIPNGLVVVLMILGVSCRGTVNGVSGVPDYVISCLSYLAVLYPLFKIGVLGAGDVKLLAAVEGFFGRNESLLFFLIVWVSAALIALIKLVANKNFMERMEYLFLYMKDVFVLGKWQLYFQDRKEAAKKGRYVHMTIPMIIALIVCLGGIY